ncbi:cyclic lactone autoinducer peptide [Keratinibaculum paraultunense]|nr:cyclic lactone autoinducer peptide [Keratinibaculum paraultunense]
MYLKLAPFALVNTASIVFWGEPKCPDELKKLIGPK